jgi:hypothetical protein
LEEEENENYFDTTEAVANFFKDTMRLEMTEGSIDFTTTLGRRKGQRLTSFAMKLEVLKNTRLLVDSKIRIDEDFSLETRKVRRELIPYLREAKKVGTGHS